MLYSLPELPYDYDALEPAISEEVMRLHHTKHHQTYVDKLNAAIQAEPELQGVDLVKLLSDLERVPKSVRLAIRNHGGGHYNHSLFWNCMAVEAGLEPHGRLGEAIVAKWQNFEKFKEEFNTKALSLFGSGWVWLTRDLEIIAMQNQDTPMMIGKGEPLMGLDVWEHAYYLDYKNKRDEYIKNWWKVVDWEFVARRYESK